MNRRALPVVIVVVVIALVVLAYSVARTMRGGTAAPAPAGKPSVNSKVMQNLYQRTHPGAPMPGGMPGAR